MPFLSLFFVLFGLVILAFPDFLAYIIGFLFLFLGINSLIMTFLIRRKNPEEKSGWSFGKYEIIKKK